MCVKHKNIVLYWQNQVRRYGESAAYRVAILGSTREEWDWADRATLAIGGIGVGVYHSSTPEQIRYIVDPSEASILAVEDENQWRKIKEIRAEIPRVKKFVLMDPLPDMSDGNTMSLADLLAMGRRGGDKGNEPRVGFL